MKLVDENGKLFKKCNLVDAIVIFLVVVILAAIGWKAVGASMSAAEERKTAELAEQYESAPHLCYDVVCSSVPKEVAEAFAAQMARPEKERQMMSNGAPVEGYVVGCRIEPREEDQLYDVYFQLEALLVDKEGIYSVASQEIRIGKSYIVKTYNIETSGYIYAMETTGEDAADE